MDAYGAPAQPAMAALGEDDSSRKVWVGNLPGEVLDEQIREVFGTYGAVQDIHILRNKSGKSGDKCAFVIYEKDQSALDAMEVLNGKYKFKPESAEAICVRWPRPGLNARPEEPKPEARLFVGNLPGDITESEIQHVFSTYGEIVDQKVLNPNNQSGQKSAIVVYSSMTAAEDAIKVLSGQYKIREDAAEPIEVKFAAPRKRAGDFQKGGWDSGCKGGGKNWWEPQWAGSWKGGDDWYSGGYKGWDGKGKGKWDDGYKGKGKDSWGKDSWKGGKDSSKGKGKDDGKGKGKGDGKGTRIHVANLPQDIKQDALQYVFGNYGSVQNVHIMDATVDKRGMVAAFVDLSTPEEVETALLTFAQTPYEIRPGCGAIEVTRYAPKGARFSPY